ncbi:restriction endonuclease subunit S [Halochromatium roseum]|uniref:restriction endonuclease subunit S n=1 Tax=Halochromatium roseum TaxID=391920 RepID=UPI0019130401|nr:restriction endonuclease subunit S [Halochromatium roseum]MBK5937988.1 hypothetical protein [Halochromatium roseum]
MKAGWKTKTLGEVADVVNGGTPKSKVQSYWNGDIQWLTPKDMGQMLGRTVSETPRTISKEGLANSSARLVPEKSVILSTRAPIGHLAINSTPMAFNQGCRGIVPRESLYYLYLYHFLDAIKKTLNDLGAGTTFKELSATNLKSISIPLPPLEEQKQIIAILDEAFEGLDRARANVEANLEESRQLLLRYLDIKIEEYISRFGIIPINKLADVKGGKRLPKGFKPKAEKTPYPYITVRDFTEEGTVSALGLGFISEEIRETILRYTISSRDVYISIAGTIGKTGIVPDHLDGANLTENAAKLVLKEGWHKRLVTK